MAEKGPRGDKKCHKIPKTTFEYSSVDVHVNSLHYPVYGLFSKFCIAFDIYVQCIYLVVEQVFRSKRRRNK